MADISKPTIHQTRPRGHSSYPVANGVTLYPGALVQINQSGGAGVDGYLDHWDKTGNFVGLCTGGDANTSGAIIGNTSASVPPEARVDESGIILKGVSVTGATQGDVSALVYANDSDPSGFTKTDPGVGAEPVGRMTRFGSASDCDVELFTPSEFLAGIAGTGWTS